MQMVQQPGPLNAYSNDKFGNSRQNHMSPDTQGESQHRQYDS